MDDQPPWCPPDIYAAAHEDVEPAAVYYTARAWACTELLMMADRHNDADTEHTYRREVLTALVQTPRDLIPPRSLQLANRIAAELGQSTPFR